MIYRMKLADSVDEMTFDLLEVPIEDKDIEGATDNTTIDGNIFTDYLWLKKQFVQKWSLMCKDDYTQLRGFYTRQWENAEAPIYTLFAGQNRSETLTASGSAFRIQNGTQYDAPLTLTELKGNATQNGTPTPDAPVAVNTTTGENVVKITGKNLLDETALMTYLSANGATVEDATYDNIEATRLYKNGTGGLTITYPLNLSDGQYTVSLNYATEANADFYLRFVYSDGTFDGIKSGTSTSWTNVAKTTNASKKLVALRFMFYAGSATKVYIGKNSLQLELGTTATAYEPYQGEDYGVNLGKNLLPFTDQNFTLNGLTYSVQDGSLYINGTSTGETYSSNNQFKTNFATTLGAGTYTLSLPEGNAGITTYIDDTTNATHLATVNGTTLKTATFTLTQPTAVHLGFYVYNAHPTDKKMLIQLERGTATTYAPYFTPIELAKIGTYQDRIYKTDGKWYVEKQTGKIVLDGTENWTAGTGGTLRLFYSAQYADVLSSNQRQSFLSDNFHFIASGNETGAGFIYQQRFYFYYGDMSTDANAFKTWLTTHPTTVYYALATPTTTEITNQTLIDQLNFIANLYGGTNNIMLVGTGAQGEIGVEYTLTYEKEQTIIPETTVRLTLTDGGVINTCECRQNVQLTMRETVQ